MNRIPYLLLACLTLAAVASCGDSNTSDDKTVNTQNTGTSSVTDNAAETEEVSLLEGLGDRDLGGMVYTIFDCNSHPDLQINMPGDEMNGDVVNDALLARDIHLEEKYNCDIQYFQENAIGKLKSMVTAGDDEWQMIFAEMTVLNGQATSGMLANMCAMPHMEMDKQWWNPLLYDTMRQHDAM